MEAYAGEYLKKRKMSFTFEKTPVISLTCKLVPVQYREYEYGLFRYIKIQPNTVGLSTKLWGIKPTNSVVIPQSLVLKFIVFSWVLLISKLVYEGGTCRKNTEFFQTFFVAKISLQTMAKLKVTFLGSLKTKDYEKYIFFYPKTVLIVTRHRLIKSATCWRRPRRTWEKITPTRTDQNE